MNQNEFVESRAAAHKAACQGVASDPTVLAALAMRTADLEVKAAMAARAATHARKSDQIAQIVFATVAVESTYQFRRQAG